MPLKSLLPETGLNADQTAIIGTAFDDAWAQIRTTPRWHRLFVLQ